MKLKAAFLTLNCLLCLNAVVAEDGPKLKDNVATDSIQFVKNFSPDLRAGTLIFGNLTASTELGKGSLPRVHTKKFTFVLEPENEKKIKLVQHFRGFVDTSGGASAALIVHSAGKTTAVDLPQAIENAKKEADKDHGKKTEESSNGKKRTEESNDFFVEIINEIEANQPVQTTVILLVDQAADEDSGALIVVDSIDFEIFELDGKR